MKNEIAAVTSINNVCHGLWREGALLLRCLSRSVMSVTSVGVQIFTLNTSILLSVRVSQKYERQAGKFNSLFESLIYILLKIQRTGTKTKIFSEQDQDQNVLFLIGTATKIFLTGTGTKICFWRDRDRDLKLFPAGTRIFFSPGPERNFFSHRDRDQKWLVPLMSNWNTRSWLP